MTVKFGDPQSIAERDKGRAEGEATSRECRTCSGTGTVAATISCGEAACRRGHHEIESDCHCCYGTGELSLE